jgi:hypothetical protein
VRQSDRLSVSSVTERGKDEPMTTKKKRRRPTTDPNMRRSEVVGVRLTTEQHARLLALARRRGRQPSALLRETVLSWLKEKGKSTERD